MTVPCSRFRNRHTGRLPPPGSGATSKRQKREHRWQIRDPTEAVAWTLSDGSQPVFLRPRLPPHSEHQEDQERPDQVELLFDRKRPGVQQRRVGPGEVAGVAGYEVPVREISEGRGGIRERRRSRATRSAKPDGGSQVRRPERRAPGATSRARRAQKRPSSMVPSCDAR